MKNRGVIAPIFALNQSLIVVETIYFSNNGLVGELIGKFQNHSP